MSCGLITMSRLGQMGRFANQLVQYMFVKTYAVKHDLAMQIPPWIGNQLFGCREPQIDRELPVFEEPYDKDPQKMVIPLLAEPLRNVDLSGFFQYPTSYYAPHREEIRRMFTPVEPLKSRLDEGVRRLRERGKTIVGLHIRRGDYGYDYFYITPMDWYLQWLNAVWPTVENPVLFVATDAPRKVLRDLAAFHPVTSNDLRLRVPEAPYYPDFYLLSQADMLAIPNSTFSFVAAMLNENLQAAYRSHLSDPLESPPFREFDPWDDIMLDCNADVERFPNILGIRKEEKSRIRFKERLRFARRA